MRNYIIFYVILVAFIAGGIYLTSYTLEKEKREKFESTNHHARVTEILEASEQVKKDEVEGKSLVFFSWVEYGIDTTSFKNLNDLVMVSPENVKVMSVSNADKEYSESYFTRKKIVPQFTILYKQQVLNQYLDEVVTNFYDADSLKFMKRGVPVTVVINPKGQVKLAKKGVYPELIKDVRQALAE